MLTNKCSLLNIGLEGGILVPGPILAQGWAHEFQGAVGVARRESPCLRSLDHGPACRTYRRWTTSLIILPSRKGSGEPSSSR